MDPMELAQLTVSLISAGVAGGIAVTIPTVQLKALRNELTRVKTELHDLRGELSAQSVRTNSRIDSVLQLVAKAQR